MQIELTQALMLSGATGICTAAMTVAAIKTDLGWIKKELERHEKDLNEVFNRLRELESKKP